MARKKGAGSYAPLRISLKTQAICKGNVPTCPMATGITHMAEAKARIPTTEKTT